MGDKYPDAASATNAGFQFIVTLFNGEEENDKLDKLIGRYQVKFTETEESNSNLIKEVSVPAYDRGQVEVEITFPSNLSEIYLHLGY